MTNETTKPTIVLVHGAWADGSSWDAVTRALQAQGYPVLVPPNLLRGLTDDAAYIASFLAQRTSGPVVLAGHSYGGAVITNAGTSSANVGALVFVNAFMPDEGETVLQILDGSGSALAVADPTTVIAWLADRGIRTLAAHVDANLPYTDVDLTGPLAIALGSEAEGLTEAWQAHGIEGIRLPMLGVADSLNVSVSAAILLYEARRQRDAARAGTQRS